jgi:glycosyltransferase involved in cell wall biosynthesis
MKILIPVSSFERAGGFRVLSELANHWTASGHVVHFLVDARSSPPYFPTIAPVLRFLSSGALLDDGMPQPQFGVSGNARSIYMGMWRALSQLGSNYDVILANHSFTALPVSLARTGAARKWYYIQAYEPEYYSYKAGWRERALQALSRFSYRLPLRQVANAPIYVGYREIKALKWIPPGMDMRLYQRRVLPPAFTAGEKIVIGTIGRREPTKGTKDVLEAFELLAARHEHVHLSVAFGNLPDGWSHPRATVVEPVGDAALAEYYRSVDVLVAAGTVQHGACHYPVLEAMACGTPVITTGYLPADSSNAWLVPVHSPQAIANAVEQVAGMPPALRLEMLDKAAADVARFDWPQVAADFMGLLSYPASKA